VDTKYWKFGTKFYIEGFGVVEAQDTGSAIKGRERMDVALLDKAKAYALGVEKRKVWVINEQ
jgi:3D (Asp-Asp-Asp) domain-containing protein